MNDIWTIVTKEERRDYDAVVIAAPYHTSHISLPAELSSLIPPQPYIHLHVTLLTTTAATPNPVYFGKKPGAKVPTFVLTTLDGVRRGGRAPEFNVLAYIGQATFAKNGIHDRQGTGEWIVKISPWSTYRMSGLQLCSKIRSVGSFAKRYVSAD